MDSSKKPRIRNLIVIAIVVTLAIISLPYLYAQSKFHSTERQAELNAKGFSEGSAFSFGLGDTVNLFNGNLIVTATDVYLPGRNGHDLRLTRQYNSNIFLHYANINELQSPCEKNAACPECDLTDGQYGNFCDFSKQETSWQRPKWLGLGWDMTPGRVKDPTPILANGGFKGIRLPVPGKGLKQMSLVVDNAESEIVHPNLFSVSHTFMEYSWGTDVYDNDRTDNKYTAYLEDLSPVSFEYSDVIGQPIQAEYFDRAGTRYTFNHYVRPCDTYDDLPYSSPGLCDAYNKPGNIGIWEWAENPYTGMYATQIKDVKGNLISINYIGQSPYINYITDSLGREIGFNVEDYNTINGRLDFITYKNYNGQDIFIKYIYGKNANNLDLLTEVHITDAAGIDLQPPTKYLYDSVTSELTGIAYPTGALVEYRYDDEDVLTYNYFFPGYDESQLTKHRVVKTRKVTVEGSSYTWTYDYSYQINGNDVKAITEVTDPRGNRVRYTFLPASLMPNKIDVGPIPGPSGAPITCSQVLYTCYGGETGSGECLYVGCVNG